MSPPRPLPDPRTLRAIVEAHCAELQARADSGRTIHAVLRDAIERAEAEGRLARDVEALPIHELALTWLGVRKL